MKKIIFLLLLTFLILSCSEDKENPDYEMEIAVYSYLYVDKPVSNSTMMITKSMPIDDYYEMTKASVNAEVTLEDRESHETWTFTPIDTAPWYYETQDTTPIKETRTYRLTIVAEGKTITAETQTPSALEMLNAPPTYPEKLPPDEMVSYPFVFRCANPNQFGMMDAYCEEEWYDAYYIDRVNSSDDQPEDAEEYEGGPNGEPRHIWGFSKLKDLSKAPEYGENVYQIEWYGSMILFYGRYTLTVLAMDSNYHKYIYTEHPELNGGIVGGIGVFGSASMYQYDVYVAD